MRYSRGLPDHAGCYFDCGQAERKLRVTYSFEGLSAKCRITCGKRTMRAYDAEGQCKQHGGCGRSDDSA
jgi:hypothetical protein